MVTFDEARALVAAAMPPYPVATYGWENDDVFVIAFDYGDDDVPFDEPDWLVDKRTGTLRKVHCLLGRDPLPNKRPINNPSE